MAGAEAMSPRPSRILVVTDDHTSGRLVQEILAGAGFAVGLADTLQVTSERIEVGAPELVVLDTVTPKLPDWSVLDIHLKLAHRPPMLLLSGTCLAPEALAAFRLAVVGHLSKPFAADALVERCRRALSKTPPAEPPASGERRLERRRRFLGDAVILTEQGQPSLKAEVCDISPAGAQIDLGAAADRAYEKGSRLCLSLALPPTFEPTELVARVEWCCDGFLGLSFADLPAETRRHLEARRTEPPQKGD
jgi:DNA-binding response OmpR family regulator